jgi:glycoside/pentoside/hexuronide:cation symporter, GPH family
MIAFAIRRRTVAAYVLPSIPISALGLPLVVHLPAFYAETTGLGVATVGLLFMVARLWDVVTDPVLGIVSDRLETRWGRRRPWLVASVPVVALAAWMIFMPPEQVSTLYLMFWMLVLYVGYTLVTLSHLAWGAELSPDYHERSRIQGWREFAFIVGMLTVLMIPALLELGENFGGGSPPAVTTAEAADAADAAQKAIRDDGVVVLEKNPIDRTKLAAMGWFIILLMPITVILAVTFAPERKTARPKQVPWSETWKLLKKNHALRRILMIDFLIQLAPGISGATYIFFIAYYAGQPVWANLILAVYFLSAVAGVPIWSRFSYRFGKHRTLAGSVFYAASILPLFFLAPFVPFWALVLVNCLYGLAYGASSFLLRAMMADICDYDEVHTGQARTGLYFSLLTMTGKMGHAVAVGLSYLLLGLAGFSTQGGTLNTWDAVNGLAVIFVVLPLLSFVAAGLLCWKFPLDQAAQEELRARLRDARIGAEAASSPPGTDAGPADINLRTAKDTAAS